MTRRKKRAIAAAQAEKEARRKSKAARLKPQPRRVILPHPYASEHHDDFVPELRALRLLGALEGRTS